MGVDSLWFDEPDDNTYFIVVELKNIKKAQAVRLAEQFKILGWNKGFEPKTSVAHVKFEG